jgi:hypothetical protein
MTKEQAVKTGQDSLNVNEVTNDEFERLVEKWCDYYFNKYGKDELLKSADGRGCDVAAFIESLTYSNRTPDKTLPA